MNHLAIEVVANREHRAVIERLLQGRPSLVRVCALNIHNVELKTATLKSRLLELLASQDCTVTLVYGSSLLKRDRQEARDEKSRDVLDFLAQMEDHGARVHRVPRLHAKVLYVEERLTERERSIRALISSANFTESGIGGRNYEVGIGLNDLELQPALKQRIKYFTDGVLGRPRPLEREGV